MRVALAAALFAEPDLLLLDEPTNYLDLEGALWLEARLKKYPHSALIISHDRELLNNSVDCILHVQDGKLELYTGGYDDFERRRAEKTRLQAATGSSRRPSAPTCRASSTASRPRPARPPRRSPASSGWPSWSRSPTMARSGWRPSPCPRPPRPLAPPLMRLEKASVGYGGDPMLRDLNLRLDVDDRIGLLGVNGAGKSTFAKMAAGALPIQAGHDAPRAPHPGRLVPPAPDRGARPRRHAAGHHPPRAAGGQRDSRRSSLAQFGIGFDKQETTVETCRAASARGCCSTWWRWPPRTC